MVKSFYRSVVMTVLLLILVSGVYPGIVTGIGQALFKEKANGGIIYRNGNAVGANLIGQGFTKPEYFHPRPSAAGDKGYDAANSNGSNLGPTNKKLIDRIAGDVAKVRQENPDMGSQPVPVDLVTASASGLDPHISPAGARYQAARVAKARGLTTEAVMDLIDQHTEGPTLGLLGDPVVNVLELNLALDQGKK
jgi:K+-transporting ATPase ATPase C chain